MRSLSAKASCGEGASIRGGRGAGHGPAWPAKASSACLVRGAFPLTRPCAQAGLEARVRMLEDDRRRTVAMQVRGGGGGLRARAVRGREAAAVRREGGKEEGREERGERRERRERGGEGRGERGERRKEGVESGENGEGRWGRESRALASLSSPPATSRPRPGPEAPKRPAPPLRYILAAMTGGWRRGACKGKGEGEWEGGKGKEKGYRKGGKGKGKG